MTCSWMLSTVALAPILMSRGAVKMTGPNSETYAVMNWVEAVVSVCHNAMKADLHWLHFDRVRSLAKESGQQRVRPLDRLV